MPASILVCRRIFADVVARLREHFAVESNDADDVWSRDELIRRLQGKDGVFVTGTQAIDAALLDACPQAAFTPFHRLITEAIGIPDDQQLVCGMSLGWRDPDAIENTLVTEREPVAGFTRFLD